MGIHYKSFKLAFDWSVKTAYDKGWRIIDSNTREYLDRVNSTTRSIKDYSFSFANAKKELKELEEIEKAFPIRKFKVLQKANADANKLIDRIEEYRISLEGYKKLYKEAKENSDHAKKCEDEVKDDFIKVKTLVKNKIVESVQFEESRGLSWTYPPMVYKMGDMDIFLGRPRIWIMPGETGFGVDFPSYKNENVGTIHCYNSESKECFCLGGFEKILYTLAAKKRLSDMILVFKEWLQSYNPQSRYCTPDYENMKINGPKVIDDSYTKWLLSKEGTKYAELHLVK